MKEKNRKSFENFCQSFIRMIDHLRPKLANFVGGKFFEIIFPFRKVEANSTKKGIESNQTTRKNTNSEKTNYYERYE